MPQGGAKNFGSRVASAFSITRNTGRAAMGKRVFVEISETECIVTPRKKAPRRLKLAQSVPKEAKLKEGNPQEAPSPTKSLGSKILAHTPSRMDDIREEQERRFRVAVCQSTGAILRAVLPFSDLPKAEIYAYHAVEHYFMYRSFRHTNFQVATLTAASKALKDSGSALSEDDLIEELRAQHSGTEAGLEVYPQEVREEMALLEEHMKSWDGNTRYVDLLSTVEDGMNQLLQALSKEDLKAVTMLALKEKAQDFAVNAMLGPASLVFRPEALAAVAVAMGARWIFRELQDEILKQILQDKSPEFQQEIRQAMKEVLLTLRTC